MNCATHNTVAAVAYCRTCGKPLCAVCARDVRGTNILRALPRRASRRRASPTARPGASGARPAVKTERLPSPGLAAVLGFIPGVGAMYNGQFMKGFVHVMAFVCLIWMADRFGPIMIPVFFAYFFYLVFDAYKTAHAIELGQPLPDPFGIERTFPSGAHRTDASICGRASGGGWHGCGARSVERSEACQECADGRSGADRLGRALHAAHGGTCSSTTSAASGH